MIGSLCQQQEHGSLCKQQEQRSLCNVLPANVAFTAETPAVMSQLAALGVWCPQLTHCFCALPLTLMQVRSGRHGFDALQ